MFYICWILSLYFTLCSGGEALNCENKESAKTTTMRLKLDLLCGYDKYIRPVPHHSNKTTVGLIVAPRVIEFDEYGSSFTMKTWLSMNWKDFHLTWDRLQYDNIEQFTLDTSMIWVPDLSVYNTKDASDSSLDEHVSPVMINFNGEVYSFMSPVLAGHCIPNWTNWPYDVHTCTVTLGSKRYLGSTVDFRFSNGRRGLLLKYLLPSNEWELLNTNTSRNETQLGAKNETNSLYLVSINYSFTFRRHAAVFVATYSIPGVVLTLLSLGLLWIPAIRTERIAVLCTLIIVQYLTLQYLSYRIPTNGDTTPYLVSYFRDCLALTGIIFLETLVARSMTYWNSNPTYLQSVFRVVGKNKVLQFILVNDMDPKNTARLLDAGNDEGSTLVSADENTQQWQMFVTIMDRTCFVLFVPIYLLLSVSLLPVNHSFSSN